MKAYRYNTKNRTDRKFNNIGFEKNPNAVKFYARSMQYADNYKYVYTEDGDIDYECELEIVTVPTVRLFDMNEAARTLSTYKNYVAKQVGRQFIDYTRFMNESKTARERKMWAAKLEELKGRENELWVALVNLEFQQLSDGEIQNELIAELKANGYEGYITRNEIAIF